MTQSLPRTLGALRKSGWQSMPVKEEIRINAVKRIAAGEPLFDGVLGYEDTVMPQLENSLLAGHDVIFLGERGQAKTRMIRSLTGLLDEWMPIVEGSEINDDPYHPVSAMAKQLVAETGEDYSDSALILGDYLRSGLIEAIVTMAASAGDLMDQVNDQAKAASKAARHLG